MVDKNRVDEALSALMDNEAHELETHRVLRDVATDSELRNTWHRYQLASSALRQDLPVKMIDLSQRISAAIDDEAIHQESVLKRVFHPLGKVAIAASVALVAILGVQQVQLAQNSTPVQDAQVAESAVESSGAAQFQLPAGFDLPPLSARTVSAGNNVPHQPKATLLVAKRPVATLENEQAIRNYLNSLMEQHSENAANNSSSQGVIPLARLPQVHVENH